MKQSRVIAKSLDLEPDCKTSVLPWGMVSHVTEISLRACC